MRKKLHAVIVLSLVFLLLLSSCTGARRAVGTPQKSNSSNEFSYVAVDNGEKESLQILKTENFEITFNTKGAAVSKLVIPEYTDENGDPVVVNFRGDGEHDAFLMYWGDQTSVPVLDVFSYRAQEGDFNGFKTWSAVFEKEYRTEEGKSFTVTKTYEFRQDFMFAVTVDIDGADINNELYTYTIGYEPQVGPSFDSLKSNNRYDYRKFYIGYENSKGKFSKDALTPNMNLNDYSGYKWVELTSKYFTVVAYPENQDINYKYTVSEKAGETISQQDSIFVSVPAEAGNSSTIYYYCGPQLKKYIDNYEKLTDNMWKLEGTYIENAMESSSWFGWLQEALKFLLTILYKIIPNYGVGIILITIIIKLILWPLQKKSSDSTAKMSALQPKVEEIKQRYPDNPQKQNAEMQKLYQEAGASPLGGCLPLLIQFPILIAFYGLLNNHFELWGQPFLPFWITNLAAPDFVTSFGNVNVPLIGNELHLLPVIYTASMIFSMKYTQASSKSKDQQGAAMNVVFTWVMPIMFFFILYSAPSGLLLYWTTQNVLSIVQQVYTNRKIAKYGFDYGKKKKEADDSNEPAAVRKYNEKLRRLEAAKAEAAKNGKKQKKVSK